MKYFLFIILGALIALYIYANPSHNPYKESEVISNRIIKKVSKKLSFHYNMSVIAVGGSAFEGNISKISVGFVRYHGPISMEKGRKMTIDCVETFLKEINDDEKIRPFLTTYPFTSKNVEVSIINYQKDCSNVFHPDIEVFANFSKGIFYFTRDPENTYNYKSETFETYEEAKEKVRNQHKVLEGGFEA